MKLTIIAVTATLLVAGSAYAQDYSDPAFQPPGYSQQDDNYGYDRPQQREDSQRDGDQGGFYTPGTGQVGGDNASQEFDSRVLNGVLTPQ